MKAYVEIVEKYPVFELSKDRIAGVHINTTSDDVKRWKAANKAWLAVQKEIEDLVNHYEPVAVANAHDKKGKANA